VRCSGPYGDLAATGPSATEKAGHVVLTEGLVQAGWPRRGVGDEVRAAGASGARGGGRCRVSPGF
jgi:hypothetical protein